MRFSGYDIQRLPKLEHRLEEGSGWKLTVGLQEEIPKEKLDSFHAELKSRKVNLIRPVIKKGREIYVFFRKGQPVLWQIAGALIAVIGLGFLLWWVLDRLHVPGIPPFPKPRWDWVLGGFATALIGSTIGWYSVRRRRPFLGLTGLSATGAGVYLAVREFIPKKA